MEISVAEISEIIKQQIQGYGREVELRETGTVISASDGIARIYGLEKAAVILQQQYKKIGIKVKVRSLEWSALLKIINAPNDPKDFEAVIIGWSLGLDPDAYSIWHSSQYPRGFNFVKYNNSKADKLLELGRTTIDKLARKKIYAQLWKIIAEDQPYVFLWYPKAVVGVNARVGGLSKPGPAGLFLNIEKVFVTKN